VAATFLRARPAETVVLSLNYPAGTDVAALRDGLISVTPLSVAVGLDEFPPALTSFLAQLPVSVQWPDRRRPRQQA
jgi:hypothetical protein